MATTAKIARDERLAVAQANKVPKLPVPAPQPVFPVRASARVSAQVQAVPDLFPETGAGRRSARRDQGFLVAQIKVEE